MKEQVNVGVISYVVGYLWQGSRRLKEHRREWRGIRDVAKVHLKSIYMGTNRLTMMVVS